MKKNLFVICSLIVPFCLLNPAVIYYLNPQFDDVPFLHVLGLCAAFSLVLIALMAIVIRLLPSAAAKVVVVLVLSIAAVAYVQAQILSPMLDLDMTGETIDWAQLGVRPMVEILVLLIVLAVISMFSWRLFEFRHWISGVILIGAVVSAFTEAVDGAETYAVSDQQPKQEIDQSVFEFSSSSNIIHLMPDAVQSDIAATILRENEELAKAFDGFTLFEAHLGGFHSTAPTLPSIFTGDLYDLSEGFQGPDVRKALREKSYTNYLADAGYVLDFATASPLICVGQGARCVHMPFGDFRSRGYATAPNAWLVDMGLLIDLSLFRQSPVLIKRIIYDGGTWMISDWVSEVSVDYFMHAPVLREWRQKGNVADARPRYKWYHWIGAHAPQMWDADCVHVGHQPWERDTVFAQTECVLRKIGFFLDSLREMGILESSLIVISSDHGTNQYPDDMRNYVHTELFRPGEVGTARPLLMVKPFNQLDELEFSLAPTSIIDIAPTILKNIDSTHQYPGLNVFEIQPGESRERSYHKYARPPFRWGPGLVPLDRWSIMGHPGDWNNWKPRSFHIDGKAPVELNIMDGDAAEGFVWGTVGSSRLDPGVVKVLGRDLVLAMNASGSDDLIMELEMKVPQLESSQEIQFIINGRVSGQALHLEPDASGEWHRLQFCDSESLMVGGQDNLLHFRMSDTVQLGDREDRRFSALVRSARLYADSECVENVMRIKQ